MCNSEEDGADVQSALAEWTGQRSVPNVFIGGNHIGGCDGENFIALTKLLFACSYSCSCSYR